VKRFGKKKTDQINLIGTGKKGGSRGRLSTTVKLESPVQVGMSMSNLKENYEAIRRAGAIFYPVVYQFRRELGRGRQGRVFLGLRQGARGCITEHAIKVFDPLLYRTQEEYWTDMGRIASQISRLQRLQSPNLVARHSYEETHGIGYVQMEAIDGTDLRRFMSKGNMEAARKRSTPEEWDKFMTTIFRNDGDRMSLQPGIVVYILRSVLRGLESLHAMNFLHCDIKPGNIMIDRFGHVRIVDFGRAVIVGEKLSFLLGSPMYMAPEIHRREPGVVQSDAYSVGLVGLEMLRGDTLADPVKVSEKQLLDIKMELPKNLNDLLPRHVLENENLVSILGRFVDPDPVRRHPSVKDAEVGDHGLKTVDKQLAQAGLDSEYARDISDYLAKLVDVKTDRIEKGDEKVDISSQSVRG
jgi:serine/threonine protein kinase